MKSSQSRLYRDVEALTSIRPYRNFRNPDSLAAAVSYIREEWRAIGYQTREQPWDAQGEEYVNLLASYQAEKEQKLIIGAHYDVCGDQEGADDNASAVAGLLETARLIATHQPDLDFGIEFVAYCLEEPPFFDTEYMGSYVHAQSLQENQIDVLGMICYEMIGYFSDEPDSQHFPSQALAQHYPDTGNFIILVGVERFRKFHQQLYTGMCQGSEIDVQQIVFPIANELATLSDHKNYWEFGFPAVMINDTSFLRNPNYHEVTDTIETLDFAKMKAVVDATYQGILAL
ncbi:MAG: M28 family peptidase [Bacteroidota bacterium]